ncbi:hypothetical protein KOJCDNHJ_00482 [Xanthomonas citri pv. punicae]|nr:hypothetical protein KOJCDNHJ_00482 [Xanthomonas citri pv. punicae]CCF69153.1 hypothetical protein XAPC_2876 [Xanthomonas citri pv. punicae str. LMG 859]
MYQCIAAFGAFALHAKVGLIFIAVAMRAPCVLPARFFKLPNIVEMRVAGDGARAPVARR